MSLLSVGFALGGGAKFGLDTARPGEPEVAAEPEAAAVPAVAAVPPLRGRPPVGGSWFTSVME